MARDNRIDSLKGFLIILVIIGHVITSLDNVNTINHAVMGLIYVFHMPLFILISGYLTKSPEQQTPNRMWRGVLNIFITLVVFQVITALRISIRYHAFTATLVDFPYGVLWYLMCLIYWRIVLYYTPRALLNRPWLYLGITLAVSVLVGLSHLGNTLAIQRALNFYFFFLLGYYYRQGVIDKRWWNCNILHIATAVVLLPLVFWLYPHCGNVMNGADHYTLADIPQKIMILACSVAMSLLVFNFMRDNKWLRAIGVDSLFYYLYHIILISMLLVPAVRQYDLPCTMPFVLVYSALITGLVFLMSKVQFFRWLVHPTFKLRSRNSQ